MKIMIGRLAAILAASLLLVSCERGSKGETSSPSEEPASVPLAEEPAPVPLAEWQTSFPAFMERVRQQRDSFGPVAEGGSMELMVLMAAHGCAREAANMQEVGPVQFRGVFEGLDVDGLMAGGNAEGAKRTHRAEFDISVKIEGDQPRNGFLLQIYPAADAVAEWRSLAPDSDIQFSANVNCIANMDFATLEYMVTLHDARIVAD